MVATVYRLEPAAGRVPPSDLDAEAAVLSAAMLDAEARDIVRDILKPEHMYADANNRILAAIYELMDQGQPADVVTVAGLLRSNGRIDQIGGTPYLAQLADATPFVAHADHHAKIVRDKARQRQMISVCQASAAEGYGDIPSVTTWLDRVEQSVFDAAENTQDGEHAESFDTLIPSALANVRERRSQGGSLAGLDTGWGGLNEILNGWIAGKLYVLAGRPGMGKSGLGLAACLNVAKSGQGAIFISAEMTRVELAMRAMALEGRVPIERVMAGTLNTEEHVRLTAAANELRKIPMAISERPGATLAQVRSDVRRKTAEMRGKHGKDLKIGLVSVDYIQVMNGNRRNGDSRENEVSSISKGLMWLAGETKIPVLALSQLNRELEKRPDKRPQLSDLRESGSLEQDAYGVLFVYRDEYYNKDSQERGLAEIIVPKHRNGRTGKVMMKFTGEYVRFSSHDSRPQEIQELDNVADNYQMEPEWYP